MVAVSFGADAINYGRHALFEREPGQEERLGLAVTGNIGVLLLMLLLQKKGVYIAISIADRIQDIWHCI